MSSIAIHPPKESSVCFKLLLIIKKFKKINKKNLKIKKKIIIIIISKFTKPHVCLQKAAEALVRYRSDGLETAIKQECLKMSFKTICSKSHKMTSVGRLFQMTGAA